jgi:hypothetical protein
MLHRQHDLTTLAQELMDSGIRMLGWGLHIRIRKNTSIYLVRYKPTITENRGGRYNAITPCILLIGILIEGIL